MKKILDKVMDIYKMDVFKRSAIIWVAFQVILWVTFYISYLFNVDSWSNVLEAGHVVSNSGSFLSTLLFIIGNNLIIILIITLGNMFVRFGVIIPGLLVLLIQGIVIGSVAGSNTFEFPFVSVLEANIQYLKVGLWETTAYALICGVTLTKSLNIARTFPEKEWSEVRKLKDINFTTAEKSLAVISILVLIMSAFIEAILITA